MNTIEKINKKVSELLGEDITDQIVGHVIFEDHIPRDLLTTDKIDLTDNTFGTLFESGLRFVMGDESTDGIGILVSLGDYSFSDYKDDEDDDSLLVELDLVEYKINFDYNSDIKPLSELPEYFKSIKNDNHIEEEEEKIPCIWD